MTYCVSAMMSKFRNSIILLNVLCEYGNFYTLLEVDILFLSFYGGQFGKNLLNDKYNSLQFFPVVILFSGI